MIKTTIGTISNAVNLFATIAFVFLAILSSIYSHPRLMQTQMIELNNKKTNMFEMSANIFSQALP